MSPKLLVIIATADREKARAGLMYARNVLKNKWLDDVKVVFFGPSEKLAAFDDEIKWFINEIKDRGDCYACKAISDEAGVSKKLREAGVEV
ncbi:MAG: DsrE family protein, partial [Candidatus Bathyarchaeota archaeon]